MQLALSLIHIFSQLCNQLQESVAELTTVTAEFQTAGKGQRGNTWEAEEGKNLLFSFVLDVYKRQGIGWFRKHFRVEDNATRHYIYFEGVYLSLIHIFLLRMREISCLPRIKIILIFSIIRKMELGRWKPVKK